MPATDCLTDPAKRFTLLTDWRGEDVTGWLMSEKLDGFRVMWTGRAYVTRNGKTLSVPKSWLKGMPKTPLDGELYGGNGSLYELKGMMKRGWSGLSFQIFDAPIAGIFAERLAVISSLTLPAHCSLVSHDVCEGREAFLSAGRGIYAKGGEGVVVRDPSANYEGGRSKKILRFVPFPENLKRRPVSRGCGAPASPSAR